MFNFQGLPPISKMFIINIFDLKGNFIWFQMNLTIIFVQQISIKLQISKKIRRFDIAIFSLSYFEQILKKKGEYLVLF